MLFGKSKVSMETLQKENPETYDALVAEIKTNMHTEESAALVEANKTITTLTEEAELKELHAKISSYGEKLNVKTVADACIKENLTFEASLGKMTDAHIQNLNNIVDSFEKTASVEAGADTSTGDENEPKTFHEAMVMIADRDKITKVEAAKKAKKEFKVLFDAQYETAAKLEPEEE